jgi:hypothetical protein
MNVSCSEGASREKDALSTLIQPELLHEDPDRDELAGPVRGQRQAFFLGHQVETRNLVALLNALLEHERLPADPAGLRVEGLLPVDEDVRELPVRGGPSVV